MHSSEVSPEQDGPPMTATVIRGEGLGSATGAVQLARPGCGTRWSNS